MGEVTDYDMLHKHLLYLDGHLYPKTRRRGCQQGVPVGNVSSQGYVEFVLCGQHFLAHRAVWLMHTGSYPPERLDHKDTNKRNNRIENLRPASPSENGCNAGLSKDNSTGVKGLSWDVSQARWRGTITHNGVAHRYSRKDRALVEDWLLSTRQKLHGEFTNHGK